LRSGCVHTIQRLHKALNDKPRQSPLFFSPFGAIFVLYPVSKLCFSFLTALVQRWIFRSVFLLVPYKPCGSNSLRLILKISLPDVYSL
jgi:hypothetical protein